MFWRKTTTISLSFLIFGAIVFGVLLSTLVLIVLFIKGQNSKVKENIASSFDVVARYENDLRGLRAKLQEENDKNNLVSQWENALLTFKVPKEKLDQHLSVWLEWLRLKPKLEQSSILELRMELLGLLNRLFLSAKP